MNKFFLAVLFIVLIVGSALVSLSTFQKYSLLKNGEQVKAIVLKFPQCEYINKDYKQFLKFSFEGKTYKKRIKIKHCRLLKEKYYDKGLFKVDLITNNERDFFIFPFENIMIEIISFILIELIFMYCLFRILKRN